MKDGYLSNSVLGIVVYSATDIFADEYDLLFFGWRLLFDGKSWNTITPIDNRVLNVLLAYGVPKIS